jgi:hypothetical protein
METTFGRFHKGFAKTLARGLFFFFGFTLVTGLKSLNSYFLNRLLCTVPLSYEKRKPESANNFLLGMVHNYYMYKTHVINLKSNQ